MRLAVETILIIGASSILVAVPACVSAPRVNPVKSGHAAAIHAVHNEHVASLMKSISPSHSRVRAHRGQLVAARARDYRALKKHASEIAGFADELRNFADRESFLGEDRDLFLTYVDRLRGRAGELERAAETRKEPKIKRAFAQLTATCNSCHYAFRDQIETHHQLAGYRHSDGGTN